MPATEAIPYDRKAETLPDRNGTPVRVGDYVKVHDTTRGFDDVGLRRVTSLTPRQRQQGHRKTGELDREYSAVTTEWQTEGGYIREFATSLNYAGTTHQQRSLPDIERVELTPEQLRDITLDETLATLANVEAVIAALTSKKRDLEIRVRRLEREIV